MNVTMSTWYLFSGLMPPQGEWTLAQDSVFATSPRMGKMMGSVA